MLLFALFPLLAIYSRNTHYLPLSLLGRPAAGILLASGSIWLVLWLILRDRDRPALLASLLVWMVFSFGPMHDLVKDIQVLGGYPGRARYLLFAHLLLFTIPAVLILRRKQSLAPVTALANRFAAVLCCTSLAFAGVDIARSVGTPNLRAAESEELALTISPGKQLPDIYYIMLDGYGRHDVLQALYGEDNRRFLESLRRQGFYIAERSTANYPYTHQSLPATLNMQYIDQLVADADPQSRAFEPLRQLIQHSRVARSLRGLGYEFIAFETGFHLSGCKQADVYLVPEFGYWGEVENALLNLTPLPEIGLALRRKGKWRGVNRHRRRIVYTLEQLPMIAERRRPTFTFAHVLCPHEPFVFGTSGDGAARSSGLKLAPGQLGRDPGEVRETYRKRYVAQLLHLSRLVEQAVRGILERSLRPPIIIIQGDHGPSSTFPNAADFEQRSDDDDVRTIQHWERLSVLTAVLVPGGKPDWLHPRISAVNVFRGLLSGQFGARLEPLPDRYHWSRYSLPYNNEKVEMPTPERIEQSLRRLGRRPPR